MKTNTVYEAKTHQNLTEKKGHVGIEQKQVKKSESDLNS